MTQKIFSSPPVVQHADEFGFTLSIQVNQLCTGYILYGEDSASLNRKVQVAKHGMIDVQDNALVIPVVFEKPLGTSDRLYYKVCAQSIDYKSTYEIDRGICDETSVRELSLPHSKQERVRLVIISDTHENEELNQVWKRRMDELKPDLLVWNGDACRDFHPKSCPHSILLGPGMEGPRASDGGWGSTRPILFIPGNHDVRGVLANQVEKILPPDPKTGQYYRSLRFGPLAMICLVSGEDKPDDHPVFGDTAAYELYREEQAKWLETEMQSSDVRNAAFRIVFSHIPLMGEEGDNDGTTHEGAARYSSDCAEKWLPALTKHHADVVFSGHKHRWLHMPKDENVPIHQMVGGGPKPVTSSLICVDVDASKMTIQFEDADGQLLYDFECQKLS